MNLVRQRRERLTWFDCKYFENGPLEPGYPKGCRQYSNEMSALQDSYRTYKINVLMLAQAAGFSCLPLLRQKFYFWSPAQAKVSFSRKAEAQSANRDRTGNAVHFAFPSRTQLFETRRVYLTKGSIEIGRSSLKYSATTNFPLWLKQSKSTKFR